VFLVTIDADEVEIEASFCEVIRIALEQKSISLEKRAESTFAEYRRQKAGPRSVQISATYVLGLRGQRELVDSRFKLT
jgi:hypothetical protein